jgi:hypothetical protein
MPAAPCTSGSTINAARVSPCVANIASRLRDRGAEGGLGRHAALPAEDVRRRQPDRLGDRGAT